MKNKTGFIESLLGGFKLNKNSEKESDEFYNEEGSFDNFTEIKESNKKTKKDKKNKKNKNVEFLAEKSEEIPTTNNDFAEVSDFNQENVLPTKDKKNHKAIILIGCIIGILILVFILLKFTKQAKANIKIEISNIIYLDEQTEVTATAINGKDLNKTKFYFEVSNENIVQLAYKGELIGKQVKNVLIPKATGKFDLIVQTQLDGKKSSNETKKLVICKRLTENSLSTTAGIIVEMGITNKINLDVGSDDECLANLKFTIDDTDLVTIDTDGNLVGKKAGTTKITITDGKTTITKTISVKDEKDITKVTSLKLTKEEITIKVGETEQLTANILPQTATNKSLIWTSNDENIATVSNKGLIKGIAKGTALITVSTEDKKYQDSIKVTIKDSDLSKDTISPICYWASGTSVNKINLKESTTYTLNCIDTNGFNDSEITTKDFIITGPITVTNVSKTSTTGGYKYTITITAGSSVGKGNIQLKAGSVSDKSNNLNKITTTSGSIIVENPAVDTTPPECTWTSGPSYNKIKANQSATYTLTCSDKNGFNDSEIAAKDFATSGPITVTNVSKVSVSGGYKYTITITGNSGSSTENGNIQLKAGSVSDKSNNMNKATNASAAITVDNAPKDTKAPECTWTSGPSTNQIKENETATYTLNCIDTNGFNDSEITPGNFAVTGPITVTNVSKVSVSGGYKYTITITGGSSTGSAVMQLKADSVSDKSNNSNEKTKLSAAITVDNTPKDTTGPECKWISGPSSSSVVIGKTANYELTCTDANGFSSFELSSSNFITSSGAINISSVIRSTITNGYKYTITATAVNEGDATITLKDGSVSDKSSNSNVAVTSSSIAVKKMYAASANFSTNVKYMSLHGTANALSLSGAAHFIVNNITTTVNNDSVSIRVQGTVYSGTGTAYFSGNPRYMCLTIGNSNSCAVSQQEVKASSEVWGHSSGSTVNSYPIDKTFTVGPSSSSTYYIVIFYDAPRHTTTGQSGTVYTVFTFSTYNTNQRGDSTQAYITVTKN